MKTRDKVATVSALAFTLLGYAPFAVSQDPLQKPAGNEGIVFGSLAINAEKGPDSEPGMAFLQGRRVDDATFEFYFNEKGSLPLFPTFTVRVQAGKEEPFIRTLPAGDYQIRKVKQLGFSTLELFLRDVYFRVVPGQTTYIGRLTLLFPYRVRVGSPVRVTVTDAQQEATEALRGEHPPSLEKVVKELMTGGGRSAGAGAGKTPADLPPAKATLVNPESKRSVTCPEALIEPRLLTNEQAVQERTWHADFQKTHNRLPTPMEGCLKVYEILGFVRTATGKPPQPSVAPAERVYTNPVYRWSISYPSSWTIDSGDVSFVRITSSADNALCGIHSGAVPFKTVDEFADTTLANNEQYFRDRGQVFVISARRQISLPNDITGIDVLTGIGAGGKSRRVYILVDPRGFMIDCETYAKDWDRLEPFYDRIVRSFTLGK